MYDQLCKGEITIEDTITNQPTVLVVTAEYTNIQVKLPQVLFTELPFSVDWLGHKWLLKGVITKSTCHFRSITRKDHNVWVFYDGMHDNYEECNIDWCSREQ